MCSEVLTVRDGLCIERARSDVRQLFLASLRSEVSRTRSGGDSNGWLRTCRRGANIPHPLRDHDDHVLRPLPLPSEPAMKFSVAAATLVSLVPAVLGLTINTP